MIYLFEAELVENGFLNLELRRIYGVGKSRAELFCKKLGFSKNLKVQDLSKEQFEELEALVDMLKLNLASDLKNTQKVLKSIERVYIVACGTSSLPAFKHHVNPLRPLRETRERAPGPPAPGHRRRQ